MLELMLALLFGLPANAAAVCNNCSIEFLSHGRITYTDYGSGRKWANKKFAQCYGDIETVTVRETGSPAFTADLVRCN